MARIERRKRMASPGSRKKYNTAQETTALILEKAVDLFYRHGFVQTSTRQLVKHAGMSSSAIYNNFASKEGVLFKIIEGANERVLSTLKHSIAAFEDPRDCLRAMIRDMLSLFKEEAMKKEIAIFIDEWYVLPKDLREKCTAKHREVFELFLAKVREINSMGEMNAIDEHVAVFGILGAMNWVYRWFKDTGSLTIDEIAEGLINLLLNGLIRREEELSRGEIRCKEGV